MKKPDISIIILNYNTKDLTRACLERVFSSHLGSYTMEVILCDNDSTDGTVAMVRHTFPRAIVIENQKNLGFAAGNNPGITVAGGRYVLLLNSDTEVGVRTFATMIKYMDAHERVGAATCKLVLSDGMMDPACHRGFPTPWASVTYLTGLEKLFPKSKIFAQYHQGYKDISTIHEVDCISGAFFMVKRTVIKEVGMLDEDYFMYAEDIDWAYRIKRAGWTIIFNPATTVLHRKKQSGRAHLLRSRRLTTEIYFHRYNWLFYKKHYAARYHPVITFLVNTFYRIRLLLLTRFSL